MVKNDFKISQVALLALICDLILDDSCTLSSCENTFYDLRCNGNDRVTKAN